MTMRRACGLGLAVVLLGFPPSAVGQDKWAQPKCEVKPGHFLVNAGLLYLKSAANGRFQEQIQKDLRDANRSLTQAIISNGQDKNPGAWYYLGRYYVMVKDASGADSAFRRAEALAPTCKDDIYGWRRNELWVPLYNNAVQAYNAGQMDSAIASLQRANTVYDGEPGGFKLLGQLFYNANQPDSAVKYYRLAVTAAADPKYATDKKEAMFNIAASYYRAQRWADAAGAYREYLSIAPNDPQALVGLASVYMSLGKADSANQMFTNIIARADSVDALALFFAGTSIFNALPPAPDTAPAGASCRADARRASRTLTIRAIAVRCDSVTRRAMRDYDATAAVTYRLAAKAFEGGLAKNPYYRDALYNLANTYFALRDTAKMLPAAQRLVAVDPMNRGTLRLLAQAFQFQRKPDSTLHYLTVSDSLMPFEVTVGAFQPGDQTATLSGLFTNLRAKPTTPTKLTFEFLDAKGTVVATQVVDVPALEVSANHPFQLQASGAGISAWRYKQS